MARHRCGRSTDEFQISGCHGLPGTGPGGKPDTREEPAGSLFDRLTDRDASRKPRLPSRRGIPPWSRSKPRVHRRFQGPIAITTSDRTAETEGRRLQIRPSRRWEERCTGLGYLPRRHLGLREGADVLLHPRGVRTRRRTANARLVEETGRMAVSVLAT